MMKLEYWFFANRYFAAETVMLIWPLFTASTVRFAIAPMVDSRLAETSGGFSAKHSATIVTQKKTRRIGLLPRRELGREMGSEYHEGMSEGSFI